MSEPSPPSSPIAASALTPARLKRRGEFLRVAARGKRAARPGLVLQAMPAGGGAAPPRLGFTVTKKVGNAVTRNRVRRRLKEAARLTFRDHPEIARGWDLVLIGREGTVRRDFAELRADLEGALRQVGAWSGGMARTRPAAGEARGREAAEPAGTAIGSGAEGPAGRSPRCRQASAGAAAAAVPTAPPQDERRRGRRAMPLPGGAGRASGPVPLAAGMPEAEACAP